MTSEEVSAIFSLLDINKDGKLNYSEVSFMLTSSSGTIILQPLLNVNYKPVIIMIYKTCVYRGSLTLCHRLIPVFFLLSVLQTVCVHSGAMWDGSFGEAWSKCKAKEAELWQSIIQPAEELRLLIGCSSAPSVLWNRPGRVRPNTPERSASHFPLYSNTYFWYLMSGVTTEPLAWLPVQPVGSEVALDVLRHLQSTSHPSTICFSD